MRSGETNKELTELKTALRQKAKGDLSMYNNLYGKYHSFVMGIVTKIAKIYAFDSFGSYATDDFEQEAMIAFYSAVDSYDFEKNVKFSSYAYAVIRNRLIDYARKHNTKREVSLEDLGYDFESDFPSPLTLTIMEEERIESVKRMEKVLTKLESDIVKLHSESFSYREIAEIYSKKTGKNINEKSVANALARAKKKLQ